MAYNIKGNLLYRTDHWKIEFNGIENQQLSLWNNRFERNFREWWEQGTHIDCNGRRYKIVKIPLFDYTEKDERAVTNDDGSFSYMLDIEFPITLQQREFFIRLKNKKDYEMNGNLWKVFSEIIEIIVKKTNDEMDKNNEN